MNFNFLFLVFICGIVHLSASQVKLPKGFVQCKQKDVNFSKCVQKAVQLAIPELVKGQPKFGLPPIDPLRINSLFIDQGQGSVVVKLNFTNIDINGLSKAVIESVQANPQQLLMQIVLRTTKPMVLNGTYTVNGKVLVLPISGNGHSKLILENFTATSKLYFKERTKGNELHWHLEKLDYNFNTTRLNMNLENLFNGNKELGENMNNFLNENWRIILDELRPAFNNALSTIYGEYIQRFFDRVPIRQIFPAE